MKNELETKNKSVQPILDEEGNKIGETKHIEKSGNGCKCSKTISHAAKKTKNGEFEYYSSEESNEFSDLDEFFGTEDEEKE